MPKTSKDQARKDEIKVLSELHKNSRKNIETIAQHSGLSTQKVSRIIHRLEKDKVIWGYAVISDEGKQGLQKFILLLKQSKKVLDKETSEEISLNRLENDYIKMGITIESSYYIHGDYDWMIIFTAEDLKHAKKFCGFITNNYPGIVARFNLMQILYTPRNHYIMNPNLKKLKDTF